MNDLWHGCYADSWQGWITPESFAHPAKFARGLLGRILDVMEREGWIWAGQTVLDPFGGIGCGGILCASRGIRWFGVELESRFVEMAGANFELHRRTWEQFGDPLPRILQGDSRELTTLLAEAGAVVSSPPYAESIDPRRESEREKDREHRQRIGRNPYSPGSLPIDGYGTTPGQLGALPAGSVDAVVSSPPYAGERGHPSLGNECLDDWGHQGGNIMKRRGKDIRYGDTEGQLGTQNLDTFWAAARAILLQCHAVLRPGAVCAWVTKDFVKDKKRVAFSADWLRLCIHCGFEPLGWARAMLVEEKQEAGLFGSIKTKKEKKSFFRRLHEARLAEDDPRRIDYEDVVFVRKPL
jgi:DNA modification methylase